MNYPELEHKNADELRHMVADILNAGRLKSDITFYDARFNYYCSLGFTHTESFTRVELEFSKYFDGYVFKSYGVYRVNRERRYKNRK
jgi:hypothetical protein